MPESYIQLPTDGQGKKHRTVSETVGAETVHVPIVAICEPSKVYEYDIDQHLIYEGHSFEYSASSDATWLIFKYTYDSNGNITLKGKASTGYEKVWDDRASYTYK